MLDYYCVYRYSIDGCHRTANYITALVEIPKRVQEYLVYKRNRYDNLIVYDAFMRNLSKVDATFELIKEHTRRYWKERWPFLQKFYILNTEEKKIAYIHEVFDRMLIEYK